MDKWFIISIFGLGVTVGAITTVLDFPNTLLFAVGLGLMIGPLHRKE